MRVGLEYQEFEFGLRRWGEWHERHDLDDSVPRYSAFTASYGGDQPAGHKILCAEMERSIWLLERSVIRLGMPWSDYLLLWYAVNIHPKGGYWTAEEKARKLRMSSRTLRRRVREARRILFLSCQFYAMKSPFCEAVT